MASTPEDPTSAANTRLEEFLASKQSAEDERLRSFKVSEMKGILLNRTIRVLVEVRSLAVALTGMSVAGVLAWKDHPYLAIFLAWISFDAGRRK